MKRFFTVLLLIVYAALTSGMDLRMHFCGGTLKSVSLLGHNDEGNCCGIKMKRKNCCVDKHSYLMVRDNEHLNSIVKISPAKIYQTEILPLQAFSLKSQPDFNGAEHSSYLHAPPVYYDNPLYLKNRVLII